MVICWSFDDHLMIIWTETSIKNNYLIMNCWLSDILRIIFPLFSFISLDHLKVVCWLIDYHLLIIWWASVDYMKKTNNQTKLVKYLIINCWLSDNLMIIYLMNWLSYDWSSVDYLVIIWLLSVDYLKRKQTNTQTIMVDWMIISQSTIDYQVC